MKRHLKLAVMLLTLLFTTAFFVFCHKEIQGHIILQENQSHQNYPFAESEIASQWKG